MNFELIISSFPKMLGAAAITVKLLAFSLAIGLLIGLFFAVFPIIFY